MRGVLRDKLAATPEAGSGRAITPVLPAAVRVECGGAVRTNDLKVFEPVVRRDAVNVVQDQSHLLASPVLVLSTQLAGAALEPLVVEASLQMVAGVGRVLYENGCERCRVKAPVPPLSPIWVEVLGRDAVALDQFPQRLVIPTGRAQLEDPQGLGHAVGALHRRSNLLFGMPRLSWHTRTLVRASDVKPQDLLGFLGRPSEAGEPGIEPGLRRPKRRVRPLHHSPVTLPERPDQVS